MDDIETVIDGVATTIHTTGKNKVVVQFPVASPDLSITVDGGGDAFTPDTVEKLAASLLSAARSSGLIADRPSNPSHPENRTDGIQGFASN